MVPMAGALYVMLPGIVIALTVAGGLAVSYRTRRTSVVVGIWLVIIIIAGLVGHSASGWNSN
jgi:hypothetical protein